MKCRQLHVPNSCVAMRNFNGILVLPLSTAVNGNKTGILRQMIDHNENRQEGSIGSNLKDETPIDTSIFMSPMKQIPAHYEKTTRRESTESKKVHTEQRKPIESPIESIDKQTPSEDPTSKAPSGVTMRQSSKPLSALLGTATAGGTIAAVRLLGANGINVGVISGPRLSAAAWSQNGTRSYSAPSESDTDRFLERLMAIGAAHPGQILLPTSDETAWLYTLNASLLEKHFCLYQTSIETMRRILDKKLFQDALTRAGLPVLPSWEPQTLEDVEALAPTLPYPVLIKPRTHVHRLRNDKGVVAYSKSELIEQYRLFIERERQRAENPLLPDANLPILQQFVKVEKEGVHSVTGFIDRTGELFVTRRSTKVFQRSQPVGVGICFESLPTDPELSDGVRRLCRELGHFGIFEVEFLRFGDSWMAIDFNPRLFNQIGMDIYRGMPLPLLACLDAAGETTALREAVAKAQAEDINSPAVFSDGFTLRAILLARTLTGRISRKELAYWRSWIKKHADHSVDFAADRKDPRPAFIHGLSEIQLGLKAFPRFLRSMPRLSPVMSPATTKAVS